jgi:hypothetical protein
MASSSVMGVRPQRAGVESLWHMARKPRIEVSGGAFARAPSRDGAFDAAGGPRPP